MLDTTTTKENTSFMCFKKGILMNTYTDKEHIHALFTCFCHIRKYTYDMEDNSVYIRMCNLKGVTVNCFIFKVC
jgi:hypothetical protein